MSEPSPNDNTNAKLTERIAKNQELLEHLDDTSDIAQHHRKKLSKQVFILIVAVVFLTIFSFIQYSRVGSLQEDVASLEGKLELVHKKLIRHRHSLY